MQLGNAFSLTAIGCRVLRMSLKVFVGRYITWFLERTAIRTDVDANPFLLLSHLQDLSGHMGTPPGANSGNRCPPGINR